MPRIRTVSPFWMPDCVTSALQAVRPAQVSVAASTSETSPAVTKPFAFEVVQRFVGDNLSGGPLNVVANPHEINFIFADRDIAGADVLVAGLPDAADVNDGLFAIDDGINVWIDAKAVRGQPRQVTRASRIGPVCIKVVGHDLTLYLIC